MRPANDTLFGLAAYFYARDIGRVTRTPTMPCCSASATRGVAEDVLRVAPLN